MTARRISDWWLVSVALLLSLYGIAMVYSAGQTDVGSNYVTGAWLRQGAWLLIALVCAALVSRSITRFIEWVAWSLYLFTLFLLVITVVFGSCSGTAADVK